MRSALHGQAIIRKERLLVPCKSAFVKALRVLTTCQAVRLRLRELTEPSTLRPAAVHNRSHERRHPMAVQSSAFGSVTLTDEDAKKFKRQVTYGKPKASAKESVSRGVKLASEFRTGNRELAFRAPIKAR